MNWGPNLYSLLDQDCHEDLLMLAPDSSINDCSSFHNFLPPQVYYSLPSCIQHRSSKRMRELSMYILFPETKQFIEMDGTHPHDIEVRVLFYKIARM